MVGELATSADNKDELRTSKKQTRPRVVAQSSVSGWGARPNHEAR